MTLNNEQYERIARWLDGEKLPLSEEELGAADEIRLGESQLRTALGVEATPGRARARARRALRAATGRRVVVRARFIGFAAAGAAVAAALVISLVLRTAGPTSRPVGGSSGGAIAKADVPLDVWISGPPGGEAIQRLASDLDQFEAELAVSRPPAVMDRQIDAVQQDIDTFWTDDSAFEMPES